MAENPRAQPPQRSARSGPLDEAIAWCVEPSSAPARAYLTMDTLLREACLTFGHEELRLVGDELTRGWLTPLPDEDALKRQEREFEALLDRMEQALGGEVVDRYLTYVEAVDGICPAGDVVMVSGLRYQDSTQLRGLLELAARHPHCQSSRGLWIEACGAGLVTDLLALEAQPAGQVWLTGVEVHGLWWGPVRDL